MRICGFWPPFVPTVPQPAAVFYELFFFFLKNIFCISYLTDGDFTGIINTLHSVVFVLLALEEEMV